MTSQNDSGNGPRRARSRQLRGNVAQPELTTHPGYLIRLVHQRAMDIFAEEVGANRPSPRQFAVLLTLAEEGELSQNELVERIGIDRSTLGELVGRMEARRLVARRRSSVDRRSNVVSITAAGRKELRQTLPAVRRAQERIMEPFGRGERDGALQVLRRLAELSDGARAKEPKIAPPRGPNASRGRRKM